MGLALAALATLGPPAEARAAEPPKPTLRTWMLTGAPEDLAPEDALRAPWAERFAPLAGTASLGMNRPPVWIRFELTNPSVASRRIALTWEFPLYERLDVYLLGPAGPGRVALGGLALDEGQRSMEFHGDGHTVWLDVPGSRKVTGLVRAQTRAAAFVGLAAREQREYEAHRHGTLLLYGAGIGLVFILAALSLTLSLAWREPSLIWYSAFVLSYGFYASVMLGLAPALLGSAASFALVGQPLGSGLTGLTGAGFTRAFVTGPGRARRLHRLLGVVALANLGTGLLGFVHVPAANLGADVLAAITLGLGIAAGAWAVRQGDRRGSAFLLGFSVFAVFGLLVALSVAGLVRPDPARLFWGLQGGFVLTCLSLAVGVAGRKIDEGEARFQVAFETIPDLVTISRLTDGVCLLVNPGFSRILEWPAEEAIGKRAQALGIWADPAEREALVAEVRRTGGCNNMEVHFRTRSGRLGLGLVSARGLTLGGQDCLLIVGRDVTALREVERERERLLEDLQQAQRVESLGRLAGGIAHEFNNLLAVIRTNSNMSLLELPPEDPSRESFQEIKDASVRASDLTRQLLSFARRQKPERGSVDLTEHVGRMEGMLRRLLGEDLKLSFALAPGLPPVVADAGQVEQVVMNLALNARDALRYGGSIAVSTSLAEVPAADGRPAGRYGVVAVQDDGAGMTAEVRRKILEPFFTTKEGGTGLGLSIVRGIAEESGGFLEVESELGKGSTFRVHFPVARIVDLSLAARGSEAAPA